MLDFLPSHPIVNVAETKAMPFRQPLTDTLLLLPITYGYIKMLGTQGLTDATKYAILNANYMMTRLKTPIKILYTAPKDA
jgi:glycine dehydrogenase